MEDRHGRGITNGEPVGVCDLGGKVTPPRFGSR
jgi:hypothetical protein